MFWVITIRFEVITLLREFVLTTVILPPGVGYLGSILLGWMRFGWIS